jgi:hypothetical protein
MLSSFAAIVHSFHSFTMLRITKQMKLIAAGYAKLLRTRGERPFLVSLLGIFL